MSVAHLSPVWRSTRTSGNSILSFFPQYCSRNSHKTCRPAVIPGRSSGVPASRVEGACDAFACRERLLGRSSGMSVARCFALMAERGYGAADYGRHYSSSWIFFRQNHLVRVPSLKIVFRCELPFPCRLPQPQPQDTPPLHTLILSVPPQTLHTYALSHLDPSENVEGDGDMGPPDEWCYEGKHTVSSHLLSTYSV